MNLLSELSSSEQAAALRLIDGDKPKREKATSRIEELTDLGNAYALRRLAGGNIRYLIGIGWIVWTGKRWAVDETFAVDQYAEEVSRELRQAAADAESESERDAYWKAARGAASNTGIKNMLERLKRLKGIPIRVTDMNTDPWKLNCLNGTIDLKTGSLLPHRREDYISEICSTSYDPLASSETWDRFLDRILPDEEVRRYTQKAAGYSVSGSTEMEKFFFPWGRPATGKTTFIEAVRAVLGTYAAVADFETFVKRDRATGGPREDLAALRAKRLVTSVEVEEGRRLAEALLCQVTGGDTIRVRHLYQSSFEDKPTYKLWLVANNRPTVSSMESAIWRRLVQLPFDEQIPENERDPNVKAELINVEKSGPAILAWLVEGCQLWLKEGLQEPEAIKAVTQDYREESDKLREFLDDFCIIGPTEEVSNSDIYRAYQKWSKEAGERYPLGRKRFSQDLMRRGFDQYREGSRRLWVGIGLNEDAEEALQESLRGSF